jgi:8-oxo-dGTP diphosphatase
MPYTPILATLGYVLSPDGKRVLLVHRNRRSEDPHYGKYNGLGGKVERDEDVVSCLKRELREEAAIGSCNPQLRGTVSWPGFGKHGEDWFGFIFLVDRFEGEPPRENADGELLWVDLDRLATLQLWEGDRHFLPLVFGDRNYQFHGIMPYRDGRPVSWHHVCLPFPIDSECKSRMD